jgi:hypothetical protein
MTFGVVYVAFGAPYLAMAINSLLSLRITNPGVPVCLVTNAVPHAPKRSWWRPEIGDQWVFIDAATKQNRHTKTDVYSHSPFDLTLYLDCDTMVLGDLAPIPNYLHYFDLLLSPAQNPAAKDKRILDGKLRYPEDGHFNGGVFAFRRGEAIESFFSLWNERLHALGYERDQPALVEAYSLGSVRMFPLPNKWNSGGRAYDRGHERQTMIIWHYKMRIEPIVEDVMVRAIGWVKGSEKQLQDTKRFVERRWRQQRANSLLWDFRRLVTRIRGDQSGLLKNHPARDEWLRWLREK